MKRILSATLFVVVLGIFSNNAFAQSGSREEVLKQIETKRTELATLEKKFLSPSAEDRTAYADFLKQADTGLIRLLPREVYESETYKNNKKTISMRGGGAYYSFSLRTHEYGNGTDIGLEGGQLSSGFAGFNFGIITNIGNVPFEEIMPDHPFAHFLSTYSAPVTESEVRSEQQRFGQVVTVGETIYRRSLPVEVNATYLVRSINYYSKENVLVVFRVVRKDTDGSVIIAWKILKKYPQPEVARNRETAQSTLDK
jgi:hypothetical protein